MRRTSELKVAGSVPRASSSHLSCQEIIVHGYLKLVRNVKVLREALGLGEEFLELVVKLRRLVVHHLHEVVMLQSVCEEVFHLAEFAVHVNLEAVQLLFDHFNLVEAFLNHILKRCHILGEVLPVVQELVEL